MNLGRRPSPGYLDESHELLIRGSQPSDMCPGTNQRERAQSRGLHNESVNSTFYEASTSGTSHKSAETSETELQSAHMKSIPRQRQALWQPFWLRRAVLYTFASIFAAFGAALIILWRVSEAEDGLRLQVSSNQYAWTYAPMAILVVVITFWRQVDYHCKALSPWQNLLKGPAPAAKTVLLDYISLSQVKALYNAVRYGNYAVAISIAGFVLLKISLVFSTGLLVAGSSSFVDSAVPGVVTNRFDALPWNTSLASFQKTGPPSISSTGVGDQTSNEVYTYYAIDSNGVDASAGTYQDSTFQTFQPASMNHNFTTLTANVDVFQPNTFCEVADVTVLDVDLDDYPESSMGGGVYIHADTPTCRLGHGNVINGSHYNMVGIAKKNPRTEIVPSRDITASMSWENCSLPSTRASEGTEDASDGDFRWLMTIADFRYNQTVSEFLNGSQQITGWSRDVAQVVSILCQVQYRMLRVPVSYDYSSDSGPKASVLFTETPVEIDQLPSLTNTQFNKLIMRAFAAARTMFPSNTTSYTSSDGEASLFGIMGRKAVANGDGSLEGLLDEVTFKTMAEQTVNGVANLLGHGNFLVADSSEIILNATYMETRLHIRQLPLWVMTAIFSTLMVLSLALTVVRPHEVVSCNPGSLAASAAILSASDSDFQSLLPYLGYARESVILQQVRDYNFASAVTGRFRIIAVNKEKSWKQTVKETEAAAKAGQWHPWAVRWVLFLPTLAIPLIAIAVLEVLQRVSDANQGLVTLSTTDNFQENLFVYITSLLLLLIATLYNNLDFTISVFAPFSALRAKSIPASRGVTYYLVGQIPIVALWRSVRARQFGTSLSNIAGFVGSTLTVVGSGLWLLDRSTLLSQEVSMQRQDAWNTSWNSAANDRSAALMYSLMLHQNMSYPRWTYDELAFPQVAEDNLGSALNGSIDLPTDAYADGTRAYELTLPALRANLNCTFATAEQSTTEWSNVTSSHQGFFITGEYLTNSFPLSPECLAGPSKNESNIDIRTFHQDPDRGPDSGAYVARLYNIHLEQEQQTYDDPELPDNKPGCPSLAIVFAYLQTNKTIPENITAMLCYQELQEIDTTLTLTQQVLEGQIQPPTISDHPPPVANASSIRLLTNGTAQAYSWRPQSMLENGLQKQNRTAFSPYSNESSISLDSLTDTFFDSIFNKTGTYDPEQYMRPENADLFLRDVNHAYRQYMAQVFNANLRVPYNNSQQPLALENGASTAQTITATNTIPTPRLKVNRTSKIILQVELAVMAICGLIAFLSIKIRGTMSHNPCSILGTMSLLAGSEMVERMPKSAETWTEKEMERELTREGALYSLGWWDERGSELGRVNTLAVDVNDANADRSIAVVRRRFGVDVGRAETS